MAMDRDMLLDLLVGTLDRVIKRHEAASACKEAEARGYFDDDDEDDDGEGLRALARLRSTGRGGLALAAPHNDLIAQARAELENLREREELARLKAEVARQRKITADAEALVDPAALEQEELAQIRAELAEQRRRTEAAEAAALSTSDERPQEDAIEAVGELVVGTPGSEDQATSEKSQAAKDGDDDLDVTDDDAAGQAAAEGKGEREGAEAETTAIAVTSTDDDADADADQDADPVDAHPLVVGQRALRAGDPRTALVHFTEVIEETRAALRRAPRDTTITAGLCQSLRAAATARLGLADFPGAIRDINEAVDVATTLHEKAPSAEALTEVAASIGDKIEVLLAVGDTQGAAALASAGTRAVKREMRRHGSRTVLARFERLRAMRSALQRRHAG